MLTVESTKKWLHDFNSFIQKNKDYLSELDTPIGDGDHGSNMSRGMADLENTLKTEDFQDVSEIFKKAAMSFISKVGGASGPLYGSAFLAMSKHTETESVSDLLGAGLEAIQKRGKAEIGDKTMIDIWSAFIQDLKSNTATHDKIEQYVTDSAPLMAKKGRASYLGERSIGHIDPGTRSSGYLFSALLNIMQGM